MDGEIVALDQSGRSNFGLLQNFRSAESKIHYHVFDILIHKGKAVSQLPLWGRREILDKALTRNAHISTSPAEAGSSKEIVTFVQQHGLEGIVAKRLDGAYEPVGLAGLREWGMTTPPTAITVSYPATHSARHVRQSVL